MGRDEHHQSKGKNKAKLPQTPSYEKDRVGVDMEMSNNPKVQFGIAEEEEK
ncbi:YfhD family protein [Sediminibacillus albus]|uniref:YfhD-like protein n=1 Tax=Sediminibacillus albus TaxID=407036 RepID=A0A1G8WFX7_9BACI|nr:YfhD family protein [Sediminibacillus albus]SDJ77073.1 YfhD-like protein [Sediminibacillus albus]